jgi:Xaa-Pro aminopeptidase
MAREVKTTHRFGDKPYLGFEHVTLVPMCRNLIDSTLLTPRERDWLNAYHAEVLEKTRSSFAGDERALRWVERETRPI